MRPLYGNSTFTLKNLWAELVGDCHAASVRFVLPRLLEWHNSDGSPPHSVAKRQENFNVFDILKLSYIYWRSII